MHEQNDFWSEIWLEIRPIAKHSITTFVFLILVVAVAAMALFIRRGFPKLVEFCNFLDVVDSYLAIIVVCIFAIIMFVELTTLLGPVLRDGWPGMIYRWIRRHNEK